MEVGKYGHGSQMTLPAVQHTCVGLDCCRKYFNMLCFEQPWRHDYADATRLGNFSIVKKKWML